jgi:hypothetical protein
MEVFEIHITGDESIHRLAKKYDHKTIAIDLLRPDYSCIRTEHMTSFILKYPFQTLAYDSCKLLVDNIVRCYEADGLKIARVKIESPFYDYYIEQSLYIESHFTTDGTYYPISRNQKKTACLATDREYDQDLYWDFKQKHEGKELELCLYDTFPREDLDWLMMFEGFDEL